MIWNWQVTLKEEIYILISPISECWGSSILQKEVWRFGPKNVLRSYISAYQDQAELKKVQIKKYSAKCKKFSLSQSDKLSNFKWGNENHVLSGY